MSRGKQSVRKGVWYIGGKYKRAPKRTKQKRGAIPFGLLASPNIFKFGASKTRKQNVKGAMRSDIAKMVVQEAQNKAKNKYDSLFDS